MAVGPVATVGDNCIDVYVDRGAASAVGGNALNVAVALARHGRAVRYLSAVGDDDAGARVRAALISEGVDVEGLRVVPGAATARTLIDHSDGDRVMVDESYELFETYRPGEAELDSLRDCAHVHAAQTPRLLPEIERLTAAGMSLSYDFSDQREDAPVGGLEVAFFSGHGLSRADAERLARRALERGARAAVVTLGADGSVGAAGDAVTSVPAEPTDVRDTCGAGDAYIAAFLDAWIARRELAPAMRAGARAAAATCAFVGAWPQTLEPAAEAAR